MKGSTVAWVLGGLLVGGAAVGGYVWWSGRWTADRARRVSSVPRNAFGASSMFARQPSTADPTAPLAPPAPAPQQTSWAQDFGSVTSGLGDVASAVGQFV